MKKITIVLSLKKTKKVSEICVIVLVIFAWLFSGWPQIWPQSINPDGFNYGVNKIRIPPEI